MRRRRRTFAHWVFVFEAVHLQGKEVVERELQRPFDRHLMTLRLVDRLVTRCLSTPGRRAGREVVNARTGCFRTHGKDTDAELLAGRSRSPEQLARNPSDRLPVTGDTHPAVGVTDDREPCT